jgi:ribosomal-protein-alanine N-acetyltransferase
MTFLTRSNPASGPSPLCRWMIRRDLGEVVKIDALSFTDKWDEEEFIRKLRKSNVIGTIIEVDHKPMGYAIYSLNKHSFVIERMAIHPGKRKRGYAKCGVDRLIEKLVQQKRHTVSVDIHEDNLGAQLFFQKNGFRAISLLDNTVKMVYSLFSEEMAWSS